VIQQINLYREPLRKRSAPLGAARIAQIAAALAGLLTALTLALSWQEHRQLARLDAARQALAAQQQELARLEATLPPPRVDPHLKESLARLERELSTKRSFLAHFDSHMPGDTQGFSAFMRGLARRPLPALWLRRIELSGDGALAFEGSATRADAIPAFVRTLTEEPAFQGREFRTLRMTKRDGRVDFDLRSREPKR
jgi:hypothetical protein